MKYVLFDLSGYVQWASSVVLIFVSSVYLKKRPNYIVLLSLYGLSSFTCSGIQMLANTGAQINMTGNIYTLLETLMLSLIFYKVSTSKAARKVILIGFVGYLIYYACAFIFFNEFSFSLIRSGRDFLMILFPVMYFVQLLHDLPEDNLFKFPMFWINSAILLYFSGTFVLSYFRDYIILVLKDDAAGFWAFRNFYNFAYFLILIYASYLNLLQIKSANSRTI